MDTKRSRNGSRWGVVALTTLVFAAAPFVACGGDDDVVVSTDAAPEGAHQQGDATAMPDTASEGSSSDASIDTTGGNPDAASEDSPSSPDATLDARDAGPDVAPETGSDVAEVGEAETGFEAGSGCHDLDASSDDADDSGVIGPCSTGGWCVSSPYPFPTSNDLGALWGSGANDVWAGSSSGALVHWNGTEWSPAAALPFQINDIWGSSATDVWVVGYANTGGFAIQHWDGTAWSPSPVPEPDGGPWGPLYSVWGSGPNDVWAVGNDYSSNSAPGQILHWDGTSWSIVQSGTMEYAAVWGSGPGDVWVGGGSSTLHTNVIMHWDGSTWSSVALPVVDAGSSPSSYSSVGDIWGSGANDVWAVDSGQMVHWDGSTWSLVWSSPTIYVDRMWGTGPSDVWAVAPWAYCASCSTMVHWDGSTWSPVANVTSGFGDVWASASNDAWTVGSGGSITHWDGSAWSAAVSAPQGPSLGGVWSVGPNDVWAVGIAGTAMHWGGVAWSSVPTGSSAWLYGAWGSASDDVWAVGSTNAAPVTGTILHWNGLAWSVSFSTTTATLSGVWGSAPNDVWAVGSGGTILHWNGAAWSTFTTMSGLELAAVSGTGPSDVWIAGSMGAFQVVLLHYDGASWTQLPTWPIGDVADAVWTSGPNDLWVLTSGDAAAYWVSHWDGSTWTQAAFGAGPGSGAYFSSNGIWGSCPADVWIAAGTLLHWDGTALTPSPADTWPIMVGVAGSHPHDLWAVGAGGAILHHR